MNINDMLVFAEVVAKGGFTAAGESLNKPKSNISRTVTRLEESLGVILLQRTTRKHTLTEVGQIYYQHCLRIKEELESANHSLETLNQVPRGLLRVSASVSVGQNLIAPLLTGFMQAYPEVKLDLRLINRRVDAIEENFDILIRVGELADSNLVASPLCDRRLNYYAAPTYFVNRASPRSDLSNLSDFNLLHMKSLNAPAQWHFEGDNTQKVIHFNPSFESDDFSVIRQMLLDCYGIGLLPDYMADAYVKEGRLEPVLNAWQGPKVALHSLVPSRRGITPKVRAFLDYIKERV